MVLSSSTVLPTITPAIIQPLKYQVKLGLTIAFTTLYGLLFLLILSQLLLILYYQHRRLSYQTVFLFSCLIWAALRTTLFSFYFKNCDCFITDKLPAVVYWLFFAFPVYLQYNMLSILVFYFYLVVVKVIFPTRLKVKKQRSLVAIIISNIVFLASNITSSIVYGIHPDKSQQRIITIFRVCLDYLIFLAAALILCYCIIRGVSFCQAITVCVVIVLLYISRAVYNILAVSTTKVPTFNYGWINVSDQGEAASGGSIKYDTQDYAFISFGCVLFVWELIPTFATVWFFRVRRPDGRLTSSSSKSDSFHGRCSFFDNPNRYDSDDDLSIPYTPPRVSLLQGGLPDIPNFISPRKNQGSVNHERNSFGKIVSSYGSVPPYNNSSYTPKNSYPSPQVPRGTYIGATGNNPSKPVAQELENP